MTIYTGDYAPTWAVVALIVVALGFLAMAGFALVMAVKTRREDRRRRETARKR